MNNKLLLTRPNHDQTVRYISTWAERVKNFAEERDFNVLDLKNGRAKRKYLESMLKKQDPSLVFLNGHGDNSVITGQDNEILAAVGDNEKIFDSRVIYSLSCCSGKELGPALVKNGAKAFIGYKEKFIFVYDEKCRTRPEQDAVVDNFLDPSNQVMISLIKGHTPKDSCLNAKKSFFRNIQKMLSSQSSSLENSAVRYLIWDMQNLVCLE
ncbi:MAG: hypothetical protein PHO56_02535 [Patescibacteria group bacterium]|nr:hypothetical protein [Patescibacteria group bacterium]